MNIKVFVRSGKKEFVNVCFRLRDTKFDMHYKSDIVISPNDWDEKNQFVKKPTGNIRDERYVRLANLAKIISNRKDLILDLFMEQSNSESLTSDWLVDAIDRRLHPEKYIIETEVTTPKTLLAYIRHFVANADKRKDKRTSRLLSPNTKKQYVTTEKHLIDFAKYQGKDDYLFCEINEQFYNDFVEYLTQKEYIIKTKHGEEVNEIKRYTLNSVGKYIRALKVMIADAKNTEADTTSFYVFNEDVDNVYLNETELQTLKDFDFSNSPHLDRVRDNFLCLAWTCSRVSDLEKIANTKDGYIEYRQQKTTNKVVIPLHPVVKAILEKYNGELPKMSDKNLNDYIKDCCELAGINQLETISRTVGGTLKSETMPKYKLVGSHTGRRSFCTNMYLRGLDTLMIRSISGHKTEKSFLKYIKVSQKEHAERMANKWKEIYK
jgi:hypothetical protein